MTEPTVPNPAADRAETLRALRANLGNQATPPTDAVPLSHKPAASDTPRVTASTTTPRPVRRPPAGRASRLALAGGAIGVSFGLVGAMAAASHEAQAATPAPVVQRVIVPADAVPASTQTPASQIFVMLPQAVDTPVTTIEIPADAAAPAPIVSVAAPVTESSGS